MQRILCSLSILGLFGLAACGGRAIDGDGTNAPVPDGGAANEASAPDGNTAAGGCIPPSASPACCMSFGGWSDDGQDTTSACDNLPDPSSPGWSLAKDSHGCSFWVPPVGAAIGCNGPHPTPKVTCCPIDDAPNCCMKYGGTETFVGSCGEVCDGMPAPGYPGWEKRVDSNGCPYWYTPPDAPHECGAAVIDAGPAYPPPPADAGIGVSIDDAGPPHD